MNGQILISTAYLPPASYISLISGAKEVLIEREENYLKQTFRNRCYILSSHGPQLLSVPVLLGSSHKTAVKDVRIDYSKRWQQVHVRAINASYGSAPYFEFYFEKLEKIILGNYQFLLDLNMDLLSLILEYLKIDKTVSYTVDFEPVENSAYDYRYKISPKTEPEFILKKYLQVFGKQNVYSPHLSIIDLIFNMGPDSGEYLKINNRI
jgi:hypothetical protein